MERTKPYTEKELDVLTEAETQLRNNGLDLSDSSIGTENGKKLKAALESMFGDAEVSLGNVYAAVKACSGLVWKSSEQMSYEQLARQVNPGDIDILTKVIKSYKLKDTFKNRLAILQFVLSRNLSRAESGFTLAVTNLAARPGNPLEFQPTPAHEGGYGQYSGRTKFAQDESSNDDGKFVAGKFNHARKPQLQTERRQEVSSDDQRWQYMADALRSNTHSRTAEIQAIRGNSPRETYELRLAALKRFGK